MIHVTDYQWNGVNVHIYRISEKQKLYDRSDNNYLHDPRIAPKLKEQIMESVTKLYKGNTAKMGDHMGNFFEAWMHGTQYRKRYTFVPLAKISPELQHAVISAEDGTFYRHHGIDWDETEKVAQESQDKGKLGRGASTITQQLVKNLFFTTHRNPVRKEDRSRMNVPFKLHDEALDAAFLKGAEARGLLQLKGHRSVGGMRASIYNAMPLEGVQVLLDYMKEFEKKNG